MGKYISFWNRIFIIKGVSTPYAQKAGIINEYASAKGNRNELLYSQYPQAVLILKHGLYPGSLYWQLNDEFCSFIYFRLQAYTTLMRLNDIITHT